MLSDHHQEEESQDLSSPTPTKEVTEQPSSSSGDDEISNLDELEGAPEGSKILVENQAALLSGLSGLQISGGAEISRQFTRNRNLFATRTIDQIYSNTGTTCGEGKLCGDDSATRTELVESSVIDDTSGDIYTDSENESQQDSKLNEVSPSINFANLLAKRRQTIRFRGPEKPQTKRAGDPRSVKRLRKNEFDSNPYPNFGFEDELAFELRGEKITSNLAAQKKLEASGGNDGSLSIWRMISDYVSSKPNFERFNHLVTSMTAEKTEQLKNEILKISKTKKQSVIQEAGLRSKAKRGNSSLNRRAGLTMHEVADEALGSRGGPRPTLQHKPSIIDENLYLKFMSLHMAKQQQGSLKPIGARATRGGGNSLGTSMNHEELLRTCEHPSSVFSSSNVNSRGGNRFEDNPATLKMEELKRSLEDLVSWNRSSHSQLRGIMEKAPGKEIAKRVVFQRQACPQNRAAGHAPLSIEGGRSTMIECHGGDQQFYLQPIDPAVKSGWASVCCNSPANLKLDEKKVSEVRRQKETDPPVLLSRKKKKQVKTPVSSNKKNRRVQSDAQDIFSKIFTLQSNLDEKKKTMPQPPKQGASTHDVVSSSPVPAANKKAKHICRSAITKKSKKASLDPIQAFQTEGDQPYQESGSNPNRISRQAHLPSIEAPPSSTQASSVDMASGPEQVQMCSILAKRQQRKEEILQKISALHKTYGVKPVRKLAEKSLELPGEASFMPATQPTLASPHYGLEMPEKSNGSTLKRRTERSPTDSEPVTCFKVAYNPRINTKILDRIESFRRVHVLPQITKKNSSNRPSRNTSLGQQDRVVRTSTGSMTTLPLFTQSTVTDEVVDQMPPQINIVIARNKISEEGALKLKKLDTIESIRSQKAQMTQI